MNNKILILLILLTTTLTGCWDMSEPERMLYINAIGIDFKDGQYEVYAQIISFANIAKSDQPTSNQPQAEVGFAKGKTEDEAIFNLYRSIDQKVFWGHFSYMVISDEAMKNVKFSPVIDGFIRYGETPYKVWVYTTKGPVQDVLLVKPVLNKAVTLSKLGDPENSFKQESFIEPLNFRELIIRMDEPSHEAMIPLITVEENWESMTESIKAPVISGVGVVTPSGFKGFISGDKARGIQWMTNKTKRGQVTFESDGGHDVTMVIEKVEVKVDPIVNKEGVKFDIDVRLNAAVSTVEGKVTYDSLTKGIKKEVEKEIMVTYEEALKKDIDIYHLSEQLYRKNVKAWKKYHIDGKVELTNDSIRKLTVHIEKLDSDRKSIKETIKNK
ncbi:Ger(x)C family spore germination protein [Sporosarcina sp. E16_3]|uniref:Ger(x)C family spore germination protein n=1 Tax=Sporosarcina sp. E16_3 TaxID=2789293 RepID=UPI001A90D162|nr:Ger(x)C family spore germination protein [Sporosarcina sp. E16_3]MBO0603482.1 Ger(x)C family spore germination protein [Sporosarcina sp. E16_3]